MAKVTPNIAGTGVPGVIVKKVAINPTKSIHGQTSTFAGLDPEYVAGGTQRGSSTSKYSRVFSNESKRAGTDGNEQAFYAHIA